MPTLKRKRTEGKHCASPAKNKKATSCRSSVRPSRKQQKPKRYNDSSDASDPEEDKEEEEEEEEEEIQEQEEEQGEEYIDEEPEQDDENVEEEEEEEEDSGSHKRAKKTRKRQAQKKNKPSSKRKQTGPSVSSRGKKKNVFKILTENPEEYSKCLASQCNEFTLPQRSFVQHVFAAVLEANKKWGFHQVTSALSSHLITLKHLFHSNPNFHLDFPDVNVYLKRPLAEWVHYCQQQQRGSKLVLTHVPPCWVTEKQAVGDNQTKIQDKEAEVQHDLASMPSTKDIIGTKTFQNIFCKKCKSKTYPATWDTIQKRSADEPASIIVQCKNPECMINYEMDVR